MIHDLSLYNNLYIHKNTSIKEWHTNNLIKLIFNYVKCHPYIIKRIKVYPWSHKKRISRPQLKINTLILITDLFLSSLTISQPAVPHEDTAQLFTK